MGNFDIPLIPPRQFSLNFNCGLISKLNANADDYHRNLMAQMDKTHRFDFFIWFFCTSGTIEQVIDFEKISTTAGQAVFIRPHQLHKMNHTDGFDGFILTWRDEFLVKSVSCETFPSVQVFDEQEKIALHNFGEVLKIGLTMTDLITKVAFLQHQLSAFLLYLQCCFGKATLTNSPSLVRHQAFLALLEQHYQTHHQVQFYAKMLACSPKSLSTACQTHAQKTAKTLIFERLLLESKRLLVHSDLTITQIGERLGFGESTHFAKFFRTWQGVTAHEFRKQFNLHDNATQK